MKRFIYLFYYLKKLDRNLYFKFLNYAFELTKKSKFLLFYESIYSVFKYNISLLEYFQFRFYTIPHSKKLMWAGTGFMYEYQLKMNPVAMRDILDDKRKFFKFYKEFFLHIVATISDLESNDYIGVKLLKNPSKKIVFKSSNGKCGLGVKVVSTSRFNVKSLISFMYKNNYDLVEEFIIQHPVLNKLSPSGVNTIRIITQLDENKEVIILGCRQRISVNSNIDNMAGGNLAANIDVLTGKISGTGVYSDITKKDQANHPITNFTIENLQLPFWNDTICMVKEAAKLYPQNRSIGWDIAITENGPGLIEGNHDWCKLLWQLPVKEGLKYELEKFNY